MNRRYPKTQVFQCDCHDFHFMTFEWWPDDGRQGTVDVSAYTAIGGSDWSSWRRRLKAVWRILRGEEYSNYEVVLNEWDATRLRNALDEYIAYVNRESLLNEYAKASEEVGSVGAMVCTTHMRFVPCRKRDGCVFSEEQGDVDRVRKFQGETSL